MRFQKCEFYENQDFRNVNFMKIEIWEMWILWKSRFQKCEFCEKWVFRNVNFVKIGIFNMLILDKREIFPPVCILYKWFILISFQVQPPDQNAWMQHFQLGEILKAYCHYQEAALHLRHVLELKPNYGPAIAALQDMESIPDSSVHGYTVLIIVVLVCLVLLWILSTLDIHLSDLLWGSNGNNHEEVYSRNKKFQSKR